MLILNTKIRHELLNKDIAKTKLHLVLIMTYITKQITFT